jgi:hypothetical protein
MKIRENIIFYCGYRLIINFHKFFMFCVQREKMELNAEYIVDDIYYETLSELIQQKSILSDGILLKIKISDANWIVPDEIKISVVIKDKLKVSQRKGVAEVIKKINNESIEINEITDDEVKKVNGLKIYFGEDIKECWWFNQELCQARINAKKPIDKNKPSKNTQQSKGLPSRHNNNKEPQSHNNATRSKEKESNKRIEFTDAPANDKYAKNLQDFIAQLTEKIKDNDNDLTKAITMDIAILKLYNTLAFSSASAELQSQVNETADITDT